MASKPDTWMPFYLADYLRATMHLTRDQHGGYMLLIMACWDRGGRLPNDASQLAGIAKATSSEWKKLAPVLLPFFTVDGPWLVQDRVLEEHMKAARLSEIRRDAGGKGGRPRKEKESKDKPFGYANSNQTEFQTETHTRVASPSPSPVPAEHASADDASAIDDWPAGDSAEHAKLLAELISAPRLDPAKQGGLSLTVGRLHAWRRDKASWEYDVVPAVMILARKQGPPIATWKYFDSAVAQSIANNRQVLQIPSAGQSHERPNAPSTKRLAREDNLARAFAGSEAAARERTGFG